MQSMNKISGRLAIFKNIVLCLAFAAAFAQSALANPVGPNVAAGSATFATSGNTLTVTNSPGTIINWQQFNINQNETTHFSQQSAQSTVMNRIGDQNASQILGTLTSNGRVFLVNPNGVMFGRGAVIDVAGLIVSSLNLSDANFLANKLTFGGGGFGAVTNLGTITTPLGGSVYLIGSNVSNQGVITSPQGRVLLAAGSSVSLIDSAGPELSVTLTANGNKAINLGTITAAGGHIDMFGALVEQAGVLRADSATVDAAGNIILKSTQSTTVSGEISATNSIGAGGKVQVLGDQVTLASTAKIDVSGVGAGGTALIGGDYKGANAAVQNATATTVAAGATVKADGLDTGSGGKVIVWADDKAVFDGFISARGGASGGDGGFVETSGKQSLSVAGQVNTLAPKGKTGMWLLDPASYCLGLATGCSVGHTAASLTPLLNSSDVTLEASDYISVLYIDFYMQNFTRWNPMLILKAPTVSLTRAVGSSAFWGISLNGSPLSLEVYASGTSASLPGNSGKIIVDGSIRVGNASVGANLFMKADSAIEFANTHATLPISLTGFTGPGWTNWSSLTLAAPTISLTNSGAGPSNVNVNFGTVSNGGGEVFVVTDRLSGTGRFVGQTDFVGIATYSSGRDIFLGQDPTTCTTALCITNQFASLSSGGAGMTTASPLAATAAGLPTNSTSAQESDPDWVAGVLKQILTVNAPPTGNLYIGGNSSWSIASQNGLALYAKDITINAGHNINAASWSSATSDYVLMMAATNKFTNLGDGVINMPAGKGWGIAVGNLPGSTFGSFATGAKTLTFRDAWGIGSQDQFIPSTYPKVIIDLNLFTSDGLCALNPSACQVPSNPLKELNDQTAGNFLTPFDSTATGLLTFAADLTIGAKKGEVASGKAGSGAEGKLTVAAGGKGGKDDKKKDEVKRERQDARAAEERKSPAELKREAQQARAEAKKLDGDARKSEGESRKAEAEAKKAEGEHKKAEAEHKRADGEAKKADDVGKKAEGEAKKHDGDARQAANEAKEAKTPVAKASAESKKAEAESKKADAESKKAGAEEKKVVAASKKSGAESKKAEAESRHTDAESKKVEAESKHAEAESKKAEADHKLTLAEAREAKTPEQKAAAEKRADDKRVEAIQKKAEANVKKEVAEAKKAEAEARKAEAEAKKSDADAKKSEADSKRAESESKKSESSARKSESESKKAEADSAKAKQEGKGEDAKKADARKQESEKKKAEEEKKAEDKKHEAESKKQESEKKQKEAETRKAAADEKKAAAEKKQAERREQAVKSFAKANLAAMSEEKLAEVIAVRHEFKAETLKPALSVLKRDATAADLPPCGSGSGDVCAPAAASAQQLAQQIAQLPKPRIPTVSFLPQIERKIAIVMAINNYQDKDIPSLESALPDGDAVSKLMQDRLGYDVRVIRDGSKADIVRSLNAVAREVGPNDSVTVYFAGHGYQLPDKTGNPGEGFWIPADGSAKEPSKWISNNDVSKLLANIPAKQVMLVSDSCYSGALAKEQKVTAAASSTPAQILAKRSVVVMSSGGEEPVSDDGNEGHSIFAWSLMNAMKNVDKIESGAKLYESVRKNVIEAFPQVPQYGGSTSAGHVSGGDYLFEARKY